MTNGDKIRNMTDEELAAFLLSEDAQACAHCDFYDCEALLCTIDDLCIVEGETDPAQAMLLAWLSTETFSERSESLCKDCKYFIGYGFGCSFDGSCPHN